MSKVDDYGQRKRFNNTVKFIDAMEVNASILSIGNEHPFDQELCEIFGAKYNHTTSDLDYWLCIKDGLPIFKTVFCFDVIEFIMNPLELLLDIADRLNKDSRLYITYQYNPLTFFWSPLHFVQYPKRSFEKLIEKAGFEIVHRKRIWFENYSLRGIRPILKALSASRYYYKLRVKR